MKTTVVIAVAVAALNWPLVAQEHKPVPNNSVRVFIPGCTKGYMFTAGPRTEDQAGRSDIPEGTHLRLNLPKKMMAEIKAREGSMIEITGLIKKDQLGPQDGVGIGHGVRMTPGPSIGGSVTGAPLGSQVFIDVEGWRPVVGRCPSR